jgi:hypothetical protein
VNDGRFLLFTLAELAPKVKPDLRWQALMDQLDDRDEDVRASVLDFLFKEYPRRRAWRS